MTTIIIENSKIENKYSSYEIKLLFLDFLENKLNEKEIDLYEVSVDNLPAEVEESYKNLNKINFIKR